MIRAVLYGGKTGYTGFRAAGHSGYDEYGRDVVCAAVSVLGCTCVNALENLHGVLVRMRENDDGILDFDLPVLPEDRRDGAQLLMGALAQGLRDVQEQYPKYLRLEIKERRENV